MTEKRRNISIYLSPECEEILRMIADNGDKRGRTEIFSECLQLVYGSILGSDINTVMVNAFKSYHNRKAHLAGLKTENPEEYKRVQVAWISSPERYGKFRLAFPNTTPDEIFEVLESP